MLQGRCSREAIAEAEASEEGEDNSDEEDMDVFSMVRTRKVVETFVH